MLEILINLFALSISAGFIGAISGLGGGVFIVPALVVLAHMPMKVAVGASLISVVATSAGASVAFVRDGWTNLKVAMVLECATVTGAVIGAYLAGVVPTVVLELLFAAMMLQSLDRTFQRPHDVDIGGLGGKHHGHRGQRGLAIEARARHARPGQKVSDGIQEIYRKRWRRY